MSFYLRMLLMLVLAVFSVAGFAESDAGQAQEPRIVYKITDDNGQEAFVSVPPTDRPYEVVEIEDTNIIQSEAQEEQDVRLPAKPPGYEKPFKGAGGD